MVGAGRLETIHEAAKAEGRVVLYSSLNLDDVKDLFPLFEARFPGVKIQHIRATGERLLERIVAEARAGGVRADVFETSGFEVYRAMNQGLIEPFCPPNLQELNPGLYDSGCHWIGVRTNHDIIAWSTNLVSRAALADLAGRYTLHPKVTSAPYTVPSAFKAYASRPEHAQALAMRQRQWDQLFGR